MNQKRSSPPTQRAIANAVGVSRETVSHILNGIEAHRYNEETRRKVLKAAEELGYRPHRAAQMMRKGRSNLIGIIHFGTSYQLAKETAHYLPQAITAMGYETFVVDLSWHGGSHRRAVEQLVDIRVEGVIISHQVESFGVGEVEILARAGIPAVTLAGNEKLDIPAIYADSSSTLAEMVRHLNSLGHKRLLLLANDYQSRPTLNRIHGFQNGLQQCPETTGQVVRLLADRGGFNAGNSAYEYTRELIARQALPDVILCTNDQWARGVFSAVLEAGLRVPEDVAITGFDNESFGAHAPYYLTTAAPDIAAECGKAVEVLMEGVAGRPLPRQHYVFPCKMIVRRSCGAATVFSQPHQTIPTTP